jgi:putative hemolysin
MGASGTGAEIHRLRAVAMVVMRVPVVVMLVTVMVTVVMTMMMMIIIVVMSVVIAMVMPIMMPVAMHGSIGVGVLVRPVPCSAFDRGLACRASANCTHQSTSSSLILSSSPEVICN